MFFIFIQYAEHFFFIFPAVETTMVGRGSGWDGGERPGQTDDGMLAGRTRQPGARGEGEGPGDTRGDL